MLHEPSSFLKHFCEGKQIDRTGKAEKRVQEKGNIHEPSSFLKLLPERKQIDRTGKVEGNAT